MSNDVNINNISIFNHFVPKKKTCHSFGFLNYVCIIVHSNSFSCDAKFGAASCGHCDFALFSKTAGSG